MKTHKHWRLPFRSQWKMSILVVGFLGLFLGSTCILADNYQLIWYDSFSGNAFDSGWIEGYNGKTPPVSTPRYLSGGKAFRNASQWGNFSTLLRPDILSNGKSTTTFIKNGSNATAPALFARYTSGENNQFYLYWLLYGHLGSGNVVMAIKRYTIGDNLATSGTTIDNFLIPNISDGTPLKLELEIENLGTNSTRLIGRVYELFSGTPIGERSVIDTGHTIPSGQWGISSYSPVGFDEFELYQGYTLPSIFANKNNIEFGDTITYSVNNNEHQVVWFSDNGEGGIFTPSNEATLTSENGFTQSILYTPTHLGNIVITALSSGVTNEFTNNIFVSPYAMHIGFIGDSITARIANNGTGNFDTENNAVAITIKELGTGFVGINKGVSASTTRSWLNSGYLSSAITAFQNTGVDIVSLMLGSNDANNNFQISSGEYKQNLQIMIDTLKDAGVRQVILQNPIYRDTTDRAHKQRLLDYQTSIEELIIENGGYVLQGGIDAYTYFQANTGALGDGLHPTEQGHIKLGEFRANSIMSSLAYQINPDHHFTGGSNHTLGTSGSLTFRVDKYFGEFSDVVKVDASPLTSSEYEATSGSTTIELTADYLNTLSTGNHTLSVGFEGGVWVEEDFTILPDPTPVPPVLPPVISPSPSSSGGGGGGASLSKDSCPNGDFSASYYDKTCGTTADVADEVAKKVNVLRPLIVRIFLTATDAQKTFVHNLITSCSQTNKKEVIKLACQELVEKWDF